MLLYAPGISFQILQQYARCWHPDFAGRITQLRIFLNKQRITIYVTSQSTPYKLSRAPVLKPATHTEPGDAGRNSQLSGVIYVVRVKMRVDVPLQTMNIHPK